MFANSGMCGVIFSRNWLERANKSASGVSGGVSHEELRDRLDAFDGCFLYSERHMQTLDMCIDELVQEEAEFFSTLNDDQKNQARRVLREVYKRAEQTAINPMAIYESGKVLDKFSDPHACVAKPYRSTAE